MVPGRLIETHQSSTFSWREAPGGRGIILPHEDLGPVLVVASGDSPRNILGADQPEAKTVSLGLVFRGIPLQVGPKPGCQRVLGCNCRKWPLGKRCFRFLAAIPRVEDRAEPRSVSDRRKFEVPEVESGTAR